MIQLYDLVTLQTSRQFIEQLNQNSQSSSANVSTHDQSVVVAAIEAYNQQLRQLVIKGLAEHGLGLCTVDDFLTHLVPEHQLQAVHHKESSGGLGAACPDCLKPEATIAELEYTDPPQIRGIWTEAISTDFYPPAVAQWGRQQGLPRPVRANAGQACQ